MSSSGSLLQYFASTLQSVAQHIVNYPLTDMKFVIPITFVVLLSVYVRHLSVRQKIDSSPTLEKKRERFKLPMDRFNMEVDIILREDYRTYVRAMENDIYEIELIRKRFKKLLKKYNRYEFMSRSAIERRKKKGLRLRKSILNDLIDTYSEIKKMNLSAITLEVESE